MKLNIKIRFLMFTVLTILSLLTYDIAIAESNSIEYKNLTRKLKDNKRYIWTIEFNQEVDTTPINLENIYILNKYGNKLNSINITVDKNIIKLKNKYDYRTNEEYKVVIENNLKSALGKNLLEPIKFPFMIVLDRPAAPDAPKVKSRPSSNTIRLEEIKDAEYSIYSIEDSLINELKWQDSNIFVNLESNTSYRFVARIKETSDNLESAISPISETIKTTNDYVIVRFNKKIGFEGMVPFGVASIETNVPDAYLYELRYVLAGEIREVTPRTAIDSMDPPLFRYTEYVDVKLYDKLGKLVQEFTDIRVEE